MSAWFGGTGGVPKFATHARRLLGYLCRLQTNCPGCWRDSRRTPDSSGCERRPDGPSKFSASGSADPRRFPECCGPLSAGTIRRARRPPRRRHSPREAGLLMWADVQFVVEKVNCSVSFVPQIGRHSAVTELASEPRGSGWDSGRNCPSRYHRCLGERSSDTIPKRDQFYDRRSDSRQVLRCH